MQRKDSVENIVQILDEGHVAAFTDFYIQFFEKLSLESDKYVRNIHVAEEIVQEVFLKISERSEHLTHINSIKSCLYRSVINLSIKGFFCSSKFRADAPLTILSDFNATTIKLLKKVLIVLYTVLDGKQVQTLNAVHASKTQHHVLRKEFTSF